jgi:protein phosphatase 2C family protein 2/3
MPDGKVDHTISFFGVFDGHGGSFAAEYAVKRLHAFIAKEKDLLPTEACDGPVPVELAILRAFHDFDKELSLQNDEGAHSTGTTAAVALVWQRVHHPPLELGY